MDYTELFKVTELPSTDEQFAEKVYALRPSLYNLIYVILILFGLILAFSLVYLATLTFVTLHLIAR